MFFCDATSTQWQNAAYEQFHAQLKNLHVEMEVPYYYLEWREALSRLGIAPACPSDGWFAETKGSTAGCNSQTTTSPDF